MMQTQTKILSKAYQTISVLLLMAFLPNLLGQFSEPVLAQDDTPLMFIENIGQFPGEGFIVPTGRAMLRVTADGLWLTMLEPQLPAPRSEVEAVAVMGESSGKGIALKLSFVGANPQPHLEPFNPVDVHLSFFHGQDPTAWRSNVPVWGGVRYLNLYPGLDLELSSEHGQLVQRLVVHQADVATAQTAELLPSVRLQIEGANQVAVADNHLRLSTDLGEVIWPLLEVVDADGNPLELATAPVEVNHAGEVIAPFAPPFATEVALLSSPVRVAGASDLQYSTLLGGAGTFEYGLGLDIDAGGYAYVTGQADFGFPSTPGVFDPTIEGVFNDAFVAKLAPNGGSLIFATFLGGSDWETSYGIEVDQGGEIYVAGHTSSPDFPTTPGAFDTVWNGPSEVFVAKLNPTGTSLIYATLFGGNSADFGWDVAIDDNGNAYVTGTTDSPDFPVTPGAFDQTYAQGDAFAVKLNSDGSDLVYGTFLGGNSFESGYGIAVDAEEQAVVVGRTDSADFPTTPGAVDTTPAQIDGFVVKLSVDGANLVYGTLLGGSEFEQAEAVALDPAGNAYVTGNTRSPDFPLSEGAFGTECDNCEASLANVAAFVTKITPDGSAFVYSGFLGGNQPDYGLAIAVSTAGSAYVTGYTYSPNFPVTPDAFDTVCESCAVTPFNRPDVFVSRVNSNGTELLYSTFLGGDIGLNGQGGIEWGAALAVDDDGHVYVTGPTSATDFPITAGAYDTILEGFYDVFISKLFTGSDELEPEPEPTPIPLPPHVCAPTLLGGVTVGNEPRGVAVDPQRERVYVANFGSNSVSVIDGSSNTVIKVINGIQSANGVAFDAAHNIIWSPITIKIPSRLFRPITPQRPLPCYRPSTWAMGRGV